MDFTLAVDKQVRRSADFVFVFLFWLRDVFCGVCVTDLCTLFLLLCRQRRSESEQFQFER